MSQDDAALTVVYTVIAVIMLGMHIAAKHSAKRDADFGDFFMALIWPISVLLILGYWIGSSGNKEKK